MNEMIHSYIQANQSNFQKPISAFVTFKSVKGSQVAKRLLKNRDEKG